MRLLGIDYGSKRIGLSVSNEEGSMAFPLSVVTNSDLAVKEIHEIAKQYNVSQIIIGESRALDMSENKIYPDIVALKQKLEEFGYFVHLELEFMTSIQATHIQGQNKMIDASAATIILQSFIDRKRSERK